MLTSMSRALPLPMYGRCSKRAVSAFVPPCESEAANVPAMPSCRQPSNDVRRADDAARGMVGRAHTKEIPVLFAERSGGFERTLGQAAIDAAQLGRVFGIVHATHEAGRAE